MRLTTVFRKDHQKIVAKCCLRESSVFYDKKAIFFIEKSNENETLYSGKRFAGQNISNKLFELKYLFASLASISTHLFPISPHANCASYDPHHSLLIFFL